MWQKADDILGFDKFMEFAGGGVDSDTLTASARPSPCAGSCASSLTRFESKAHEDSTTAGASPARQHQLERKVEDLSRRLAREQQTVSRLLRDEDEWEDVLAKWQRRAFSLWLEPFFWGALAGAVVMFCAAAPR